MLIFVPLFFFVLIPGLAFFLSGKINAIYPFQFSIAHPFNYIIGAAVFLPGIMLFIWTVSLLLTIGEGSPAPVMPTRKLVTVGPYAICRNPMVLGVIIWIIGLGIILNSIYFIGIGLAIPSIYLGYIKLFEEKELKTRFGEEYDIYQRAVPFIIPRFRGRKK